MSGAEAQPEPFDPRPLLGWLAAGGARDVVLACGEHPDGPDLRADRLGQSADPVLVLLPGCLAEQPPAFLLELLTAGAARVGVMLDGCLATDATTALVEHARALLWALAQSDRLVGLPAPGPGAQPIPLVHRAGALPVSRRALLGRHGEPPPPVAGHPGERLAAALVTLAGSPAGAREALAGSPAPAIGLRAPGCCGHGACVRACPESALELSVTSLGPAGTGSRQHVLDFDPVRCTGCGACLTVCPVQALAGGPPMTWAEVLRGRVRLRAGLAAMCRRCGGPVDGAGERCGPCRDRAADPFGSRLPPGFTRRRVAGGA